MGLVMSAYCIPLDPMGLWCKWKLYRSRPKGVITYSDVRINPNPASETSFMM